LKQEPQQTKQQRAQTNQTNKTWLVGCHNDVKIMPLVDKNNKFAVEWMFLACVFLV
jgi:thiamine kinase-like enzyme